MKKTKNVKSDVVDDVEEDDVDKGKQFLDLIDRLKEEFKILRQFWVKSSDQISALDELELCKTRMRLPLSNVDPSEIDSNISKQKQESDKSERDLEKNLDHLRYLKSRRVRHNVEDSHLVGTNFNKEYEEEKINEKSSSDSFSSNSLNELSNIEIKGTNSAKVEGVVKCLKNIINKNENTKILVFSEHLTILDLIVDLVKENDITYKYVKDNNSLQSNISEFKTGLNLNVLIMPYSFGANGLNVVEATHVLLVEPTLNKSQEIQAIGRIHRIGQTRPTFVHRFLIKNSIEEQIYQMFKSTSYSNDSDDIPDSNPRPNCSKSFENETEKNNDKNYLTIVDIQNLFLNL